MGTPEKPDTGSDVPPTLALPAGHTLSVGSLPPSPSATTSAEAFDSGHDPDATPAQVQPDESSLPGSPDRMLGRYRNLGTVGSGGMGEVHRIFDAQLQRKLVMKTIHAHLVDQAMPASRFLTEARIQAGLQHAAIVPVHEIGRLSDGRLYFTMKEISGQTLAELIRDVHQPGLSTQRAGDGLKDLLHVFVRVSEAVAFAHSLGVIHRDLKPDNVMVGEFGEVQVVDWGLATVVEGTFGGVSAGAGERPGVSGTPAYMSPEQASGSVESLSPRADIYSLGAVLYELLTGRPPFHGSSAMEVLSLVIHTEPLPLSRADGGHIPAPLMDVCHDAMAREPSSRPVSAGSIASRISAWLSGAQARQRAEAVLETAATLQAEASRLADAGESLWDTPVSSGAPDTAWAAWTALREHVSRVDALNAKADAQLEGALAHDPSNPAAHWQLAHRHHSRLIEARRERRPRLASAHEARLEHHLSLLDPGSGAALRESLDCNVRDIRNAGRLLAGPLVGRVSMLGSLLDWWAAPPTPAIVALVGLAGVGKSRLSTALAQRVQGLGARAVYCSLAGREPGDLLEEALRKALRLPEHHLGVQALDAHLDGKPMLLILDQTDAVLDGACELARRVCAAAAGIRVVLTTRKRPHESDIRVVNVGAMKPLEATMLLRSRILRAGAPDPAEEASDALELLSAATTLGGIPLAIELAAPRLAMGDRTADSHPVLASLDATPNSALHDTLMWSWAQLSTNEQRALACLCVIPTFLPPRLAEVAISTVGGVSATLRALIDAGLVEEIDEFDDETLIRVPPHVRGFIHHQEREAGSATNPAVTVFDAVATHLGASTTVATICESGHLTQPTLPSASMTELLKVVSIQSHTQAGAQCGRAALYCLRRYGAMGEALAFAETLLAHDHMTDADTLAVQFERLPLLRQAGRVDDALAVIETIESQMASRASSTPSNREDARLEVLTLTQRALAARELGEFEKALEYFRTAALLCTEHGLVAEARKIGASSMDLYRISSRIEEGLDTALQWTPDELEALKTDDMSSMLHDLAASLRDAARYEEALQFLEPARDAANRAGSDRHLAMCLALEASIYDEQGRYTEAVTLYRDAVRLHQRMGNVRSMSIAMTNLGGALCNSGEPVAGMAVLRRAASLHEQAKRPRSEAIALGLLGTVLRRQGRMIEAESELLRAIELARRTIPYAAAAFSVELALLDSSRGGNEEALRRISSAAPFLTAHPDELGRMHCKRATVELAAGLREQAVQSLTSAVELAGRLRLGPQAPMRTLIAELAPRLPEVNAEPTFSYTAITELKALADAGAYRELVNACAMDLAAAEASGDLRRVFEYGWWLVEGRMQRRHLGSARFLSDTLLKRGRATQAGDPAYVPMLRVAAQRMRLDVQANRYEAVLATEHELSAALAPHPQLTVERLCAGASARIELQRPDDAISFLHQALEDGDPNLRSSPAIQKVLASALDCAGHPFDALAAYQRAGEFYGTGQEAVVARWHAIAAALRVDSPPPPAPSEEAVQKLSRPRLLVVRSLQCEIAFLRGDHTELRQRMGDLGALARRRKLSSGSQRATRSLAASDPLNRVLDLVGDLPDSNLPAPENTRLLDAHLEETRLLATSSHWAEALTLARRLESEAREPATRGYAERNLGLLLRQCGKPEAGIPWLVRARARGQLLDDPVLQARALASLGCTWMALMRLDAAAEALHEALALAESAQHAIESAGIIADLMNVERYRGRLDEAESLGRRGIALARRRGVRNHEAAVRCCLSSVLGDLGRHEEARDECEQARDIALEAGLHYIATVSAFNMAEIELNMGRPDAAETTLRTFKLHDIPEQEGTLQLLDLLLSTAIIEQGRAHELGAGPPAQLQMTRSLEAYWACTYYLGRTQLGLGQRDRAAASVAEMQAADESALTHEFVRMRDDLAARIRRVDKQQTPS